MGIKLDLGFESLDTVHAGKDLDFIHCFYQQKRSPSFYRIYLLRLLPIAYNDFSKRDLNCDVPTIHITSNCSSRHLIWIWDRPSAHTRSVHWDQLAILGVGKTAAIDKVHGKLGWWLIDDCRSCLSVSFRNLRLGVDSRGNETWSSPCRTTRTEFLAGVQVNVVHSVAALRMMVSQVQEKRLSALLVFEVCSDQEHFLVQVQRFWFRRFERPCWAHEL